MDIRLISFDLDGTALNSEKKISPRTRTAISRAIDKGKIIVPATGRQIQNLPDRILEIPGISYIISDNGAQAFAMPERRILLSRTFEKGLTLSLIAECRDLPVMICSSHAGEGSIDKKGKGWEDKDVQELIRRQIADWNTPVKDLEKLITDKNERINKLALFFADETERQKALDRFSLRKDIHVTSFGSDNIEFMSPGTNKGTALKVVAEMAGVDLQQVMAIGDNLNDIEMIQAAGIGVAMANGAEELKKKADRITLSCDEDGVALAIESVL